MVEGTGGLGEKRLWGVLKIHYSHVYNDFLKDTKIYHSK